jgi:hypothetical protein
MMASHREEVVERVVVHSSLPRPGVSVAEAASRVAVGPPKGHGKERLLCFLEPFDVHAEEKGTERRIGQHPRIERVEDGAHRRGPADVVIESHLEITAAESTMPVTG